MNLLSIADFSVPKRQPGVYIFADFYLLWTFRWFNKSKTYRELVYIYLLMAVKQQLENNTHTHTSQSELPCLWLRKGAGGVSNVLIWQTVTVTLNRNVLEKQNKQKSHHPLSHYKNTHRKQLKWPISTRDIPQQSMKEWQFAASHSTSEIPKDTITNTATFKPNIMLMKVLIIRTIPFGRPWRRQLYWSY